MPQPTADALAGRGIRNHASVPSPSGAAAQPPACADASWRREPRWRDGTWGLHQLAPPLLGTRGLAAHRPGATVPRHTRPLSKHSITRLLHGTVPSAPWTLCYDQASGAATPVIGRQATAVRALPGRGTAFGAVRTISVEALTPQDRHEARTGACGAIHAVLL